jgi:hypothetical protein
MRILFTKSDMIMSRLIRKVTGESVSHCVIQHGDYVIHSNLWGVHSQRFDDFLDHSYIVEQVEIPDDDQRLLALFLKRERSGYDFGAMLYLGLRCLFPILPKKNLWQSSGMYLCTEWVSEFVDNEADSMITPYGLFLKIKKRKANG